VERRGQEGEERAKGGEGKGGEGEEEGKGGEGKGRKGASTPHMTCLHVAPVWEYF